MENTSTYHPIDEEIHFNEKIEEDLKNTTWWASFIAVISLVLLGLFVLWCFFLIYQFVANTSIPIRDFIRVMGIGWEAIIYLVVQIGIIVMFFRGAISLYHYSTEMKEAILLEDRTQLNKALDLLLNFVKWNGLAFAVSFGYGFYLYQYLYRLGQLY